MSEAKAREAAEKKRQAAVDMRSGRIRTKQGLATRLRTAAARVPLSMAFGVRGGGGSGKY